MDNTVRYLGVDLENAVRQERAQVSERQVALIRTLAGRDIEEHRDELSGQLKAVRTNEVRFAWQAEALQRLKAALEGERKATRDIYFGPIHEELKPLLSIRH